MGDLSPASKRGVVLKGGTAINLFIRDMPRLSVDIDLTYLRARVRCFVWHLASVLIEKSRVGHWVALSTTSK